MTEGLVDKVLLFKIFKRHVDNVLAEGGRPEEQIILVSLT